MASVKRREDGVWRARYRDAAGKEHARHFSRKLDAQRWLDEVTASVVTGRYDPRAVKVTFEAYAMLGQKLAPKTTETVYRLVKAIFAAAVDDSVIPATPCRKVTRQPVARTHVVPLSLTTVRQAADLISPRLRALLLLSVGSGLRQGEALGLTADRVDFLRREVTVDRQLVRVPGTPVHFGPLKTPASGGSLVFTGAEGQPIARAWLHKAWRHAITASGLPESATWHQFRHTYASILIDGGESVTVVAKRLGHTNPSETLWTYSHMWPDSEERTRAVVEAAFGRSADSVRTADVL